MSKKLKIYTILSMCIVSVLCLSGCGKKDTNTVPIEQNSTKQLSNEEIENNEINKEEVDNDENKSNTLDNKDVVEKEEATGIKVNDLNLSDTKDKVTNQSHEKIEYIKNTYALFSRKPYINEINEFLIIDNYELYQAFMNEIDEIDKEVQFSVEPIFFDEAAIIVLTNPYQSEDKIVKLFANNIVLDNNNFKIDLLSEDLTYNIDDAKSYYSLFLIDQESVSLIDKHEVTIDYKTMQEYKEFVENSNNEIQDNKIINTEDNN